SSERQLQPKLDDPLGIGKCEVIHNNGRDPPHLGRRHITVRKREVHVVEDIKKLSAELQVHALGDLGPLQDAKIRVEEPWPPQDIPPRISEGPYRIDGELRTIEPPQYLVPMRPAPVELCAATALIISSIRINGGEGVIRAAGHRKREAALSGQNGVDRPT